MLTEQERAERERKEKEYMRRLAKRTDALNKASIVLSAIALVISAAAILLKLCQRKSAMTATTREPKAIKIAIQERKDTIRELRYEW